MARAQTPDRSLSTSGCLFLLLGMLLLYGLQFGLVAVVVLVSRFGFDNGWSDAGVHGLFAYIGLMFIQVIGGFLDIGFDVAGWIKKRRARASQSKNDP